MRVIQDYVKIWDARCLPFDSTDSRNRDLSDKINVSMVKAKVHGKPKWYTYSNVPVDDVTRVVTVTGTQQATGGLEPFGHIYASSESQAVFRVNITEGVFKGLNKEIKLDLTGTGHSDTLGRYIEIDPSKQNPEVKMNGMRVTVAVEKSIEREPAVASVRSNYKEYSGRFECQLAIEGLVILRGNGQQEVSEIFKDLKENGFLSALDNQNVTFDGRKVLFPLKGEVYFRWEPTETVEVS